MGSKAAWGGGGVVIWFRHGAGWCGLSVIVIWFSLAWGVWVECCSCSWAECCSCSCGLIFWLQHCMLQPVGPTVTLNATACGPNGQAQLLSNLRCRGQAGSPSALVPRHPAAPKPSCLPTAHSYLGTPQPPTPPQPRTQHSYLGTPQPLNPHDSLQARSRVM